MIKTRQWKTLLVVVAGFILSTLLIVRANVPTPAPAPGAQVAFVPVDMYLDSGTNHLGSYQVEVIAKDATIVGLEGGESQAFSGAPYYDPAALQGNKIIVASFSTDDNLPTGLTRIARLHMMSSAGGGMPEMTQKLVVATDGEGNSVDAKLTLRPMQGETR